MLDREPIQPPDNESTNKEKTPAATQHTQEDTHSAGDMITIDLGDAAPADTRKDQKKEEDNEIEHATEAFRICLNQCITSVFTRAYHPPMSWPRTIYDGLLCEDGKFSWIKTGKVGLVGGIGVAASLFSISPAKQAVKTLTQLITQNTAAKFSGESAIILVSQIANTGRTAILASYSAIHMLNTLLTKQSAATNFLKITKPIPLGDKRKPKSFLANAWEKTQLAARGSLDLSCAVGANFSVLFSLWNINKAEAFAAFFADITISWFGMNGLQLWPTTKYPARRVIVDYLREQLHTFLVLAPERQKEILDKLNRIQASPAPDKDKLIYALLLNLAEPESPLPAAKKQVQALPEESWARKLFSNGIGGICATVQLSFVEASGVGIARVFKHPTSSIAIALGITSALFALLPCVGFGFKGGKHAAEDMFSDHPTLGKIVNPAYRDKLKWLVLFINLFAGGTSITFAYNATSDFSHLLKLKKEVERILELTAAGTAYVGSTITVGEYMVNALDELLVYIAARHSNEETQRLINFVTGVNQFINTIDSMNKENFLDVCVNWSFAGHGELFRTLHTIYSEELSDGEYKKFQDDLSVAFNFSHKLTDSKTQVLPDRLIQSDYVVVKSFAELEKSSHATLRQRKNARLFSGDTGTSNEKERMDDIELQVRHPVASMGTS